MGNRKFSEKKLFYYLKYIDSYPQVKAAKARFKMLYGKKTLGENEKKEIMKNLFDEAYYYAKQLIKEGFLKEQKYMYNGKTFDGNPKIYVATHLSPYVTETSTPVDTELSHWVCESPHETEVNKNQKNISIDWKAESGVIVLEKDIDVHHISYKFKVISKPKRKIHWDKINDRMNGKIQKYLYWEGDGGSTTIRYDENTHSDDVVVVWLPSTMIAASQHSTHEAIIDDYIFKSAAWLQRMLQCKLGLPEPYRRPHYACSVREPEIRSAIEQGYTFKNGEVHMDNSEPKIGPCFESENFEITKCYSELPDRTLRVESFLEKFTDKLEKMNIGPRLERLEAVMGKVWFVLDKLASGQEKIVDIQNKQAEHLDRMLKAQEKFQENIMQLLDVRNEKDEKSKNESDEKMFG